MTPRKLTGRKLLVASIGVASIHYVVGCGVDGPTSGNLVAPPDGYGDKDAGPAKDAGHDSGWETSGNLVAPPYDASVGKDSAVDSGWETSGNLVAPPLDAGDEDGG